MPEQGLRLASAVWIVLYLAVVLGRWRVARWFALAAAVYALYALSAGPAPVADTPDAVAVAVGLGVLPAVAVMAAFHQDAAPASRTGPLIALPAGAILIGLWTHLTGPDAPAWLGIPDLPAIYCWPFLAASAGYAITRTVAGRLRAPGWLLGLALLAVPILAARVLGLAVYLGERPGSRPDWLNTATTIAARTMSGSRGSGESASSHERSFRTLRRPTRIRFIIDLPKATNRPQAQSRRVVSLAGARVPGP